MQRDDMRAFTFAYVKSRAVPIPMFTHDPDDAASAGGLVIALKGFTPK